MKAIALLKKFYVWSIKIITTKEWVFTYPFVLLAIVAFVSHSLWVFFALALWVITGIYNTNEE